jgi:dGTPase
MSNDYHKIEGLELLTCEKKLIKELKRITRVNCFPCAEVLKLELCGHTVITSLLDIFIPTFIAANSEELCDTRTYAGKLFKMISPNFVYVALYSNRSDQYNIDGEITSDVLDNLSDYQKIQLVVDFVTGMTDSYAVNLLHELTAIKHP